MMNQFIRVLSSTNALIILAIVFIVSFFTVPYLFPPKEMVESMSYDYGFNNQVGVLLVGLSILLFGFLGYRSKTYDDVVIIVDDTEKLSFLTFCYGILFFLVFAFLAFLCGGLLSSNDYSFFLSHIYEMTYGKIPYKDFAFGYGPLTICLPYLIHSVYPVISVEDAYLISLVLFHSAGLYAIFELVNSLNISLTEKKWMFWSAYLLFFPMTIGVNYQSLRFVLPFWAMWRCHLMRLKYKFIFFPLSVIFVLTIAPEMGLIYFIAQSIYCALQIYVSQDKSYIIILSLTFGSTVLFLYALFPMFTYVMSFGSGYLNFPFIPSFHLIVFFLCIFVVAYCFGIKFREIDRNVLEISLMILAFGLIPVCLGRCDPGHVTYNGYFVIVFAFVVMLVTFKAARWFVAGITVVIVWMCFGYYLNLYRYYYVVTPIYNNIEFINSHKLDIEKILSNLGFSIQSTDEKIVELYSRYKKCPPHYPTRVDAIIGEREVAMPIGAGSKDYFYFLSKGNLVDQYYTRSTSIGTPNLNKTIVELDKKKPDLLLLPLCWEEICNPVSYETYQFQIKNIFFSYYPLCPSRNGNIVNKPLVDYIKENYCPYARCDGYEIYKRIH